MKRFLSVIFSVASLVLITGCSNHQFKLPPREVLAKDPQVLEFQAPWVFQFGKNVDQAPEVTDVYPLSPYGLSFPSGFGSYGTGVRKISLATPNEAYARYYAHFNLPEADVNYWRNLIYRVLSETHGFGDIQEKGFVTREGLDTVELTAKKTIDGKEYKYRIDITVHGDDVYFAECYGRTAAFDAAVDAFDYSVQHSDLSFWRIGMDRSTPYTFFAYDPVTVKVPQKRDGLLQPKWFAMQLGFCPYAQLVNSKSKIYGLNLDLILSQQKRTAGISVGILNASKEHYGIQVGAIATSAEKNCGLNVSSLYTAARRNFGLTIGLITVTEADSFGVQIGLLNFSTSPYHLRCCPIINLPLFEPLHR